MYPTAPTASDSRADSRADSNKLMHRMASTAPTATSVIYTCVRTYTNNNGVGHVGHVGSNSKAIQTKG